MLIEVIALKVLTNIIDISTKLLGDRVTEYNKALVSKSNTSKNPEISAKISSSPHDLQLNISNHLQKVQQWSSSAKFADLPRAKSISQIYIDLDTYLLPVRKHLSQKERSQKSPLIATLSKSNGHVVILGQVGAGKTTSVKRLCASFFSMEKALPLTQRIPILVRLRELPAKPTWPKFPIISAIHQVITLPIHIRTVNPKDKLPEDWSEETILEIYTAVLEGLKPLIILDGYDEIGSVELRQILIAEFSILCERLSASKIVLTSRVGEYNREVFNTDTFEIAPLSHDQIVEFSRKWHTDAAKAEHFIEEIDSSPYAGAAMKPLTLAHLCAIYERIGAIPEKPKTVYKKIISLLIEEWDEQRGIHRVSAYSKFSPDRKFDFLCHLAYNLTAQRQQTVFDNADLKKAYSAICANFGLPPEDADNIANELEAHTGLFIEASYKGYEFVHKSAQEYITAEHLVRLPHLSIPASKFPTLAAELAVATAISSNSSIYFCTLMQKALKSNDFKAFFVPYSTRLLQERPDFQESPEAFVFGIQALHELGETRTTMALVGKILKVTSSNAIGFYYQIHDIKGKPSRYRQIRPHEFLTLPLEFEIESSLLKRLREAGSSVDG